MNPKNNMKMKCWILHERRNSNHSCAFSALFFILSNCYVLLCNSEANTDRFLAVHAFGDSVLDTGNNNHLNTLIRSNFSPYGKNFKDGKATGRFCDGKLISDFLVEAFGIKGIMPSYHEIPNLQGKDIQTGLSFASAGSGYDPFTSKLLSVYTQQNQLEFFADYAEKLKRDVGEERAKTIISKSLYVISSGNNDILITYFGSHIRKLQYDFPSYADLLLEHASTFFTGLYKLGARNIAVFDVAPLGCLPFGRSIGGGAGRECAEYINDAVLLFNNKLASTVARLKGELKDSKIIIAEVYKPVMELVGNYRLHGYSEIGKGCCSTGMVETGLLCNEYSADLTCGNISSYLFWDSIHPSESAYKALLPSLLKQLLF